jgi:hypothetical protein
MTILYPDAAAGTKTEFSLNLPSPNVDTAAVTRYPQGGDMNGSVTGKVTGNTVNLKVNRDGYSALTLTGSIAPDGRGHGTLPFGDGKTKVGLARIVRLPPRAGAGQGGTVAETGGR